MKIGMYNFDHKRIWTAVTDKKLNVNKPDVTCMKNNTSQITPKKYSDFLVKTVTFFSNNFTIF